MSPSSGQYHLKYFHAYFLIPVLQKIALHLMYQMVYMLSLCTVYFKYIPHFKFYCNFWIHNFTVKCCLAFWGECIYFLTRSIRLVVAYSVPRWYFTVVEIFFYWEYCFHHRRGCHHHFIALLSLLHCCWYCLVINIIIVIVIVMSIT